MKRIAMSLLALTLFFSHNAFCAGKLGGVKSWVCFYNDSFPDESTPDFDLFILDKTYHPSLKTIHDKGALALGYISFGEVESHESYYKKTKAGGLLIDENENWPGSYRINMKSDEWHRIILDDLIPYVLKQGFDGIFIDTIDTADYLENVKKMKGQVQGAIDLIKKARKRYPDMAIALNNGLFLTDRVGEEIDALVVEDIYTLYDFEKKEYNMATKAWTEKRLIPIKSFHRKFAKPVLDLEYLKSSDRRKIKKVAKKARREGFIPYIAEIDLKSLFFKP